MNAIEDYFCQIRLYKLFWSKYSISHYNREYKRATQHCMTKESYIEYAGIFEFSQLSYHKLLQ